jgi:hypothetical protein
VEPYWFVNCPVIAVAHEDFAVLATTHQKYITAMSQGYAEHEADDCA